MPPQGECPKGHSLPNNEVIENTRQEFQELKTCDIKVSINLSKFSKNFSSQVLKALEELKEDTGLQTFEKEVKFFIPRNFRNSQDEIDNAEKISVLSIELEEWVEDYFGNLFVPAYWKSVVQHGISLIFWLSPLHPVDSLPFKILCCFIIVAAIGDDWMDGSKKEENDAKDGLQNRTEFIKLLKSMMGDAQDMDEFQDMGDAMNNSKMSTMDIMTKEPIIPAFYDALTYITDLLKEFQPRNDDNSLFRTFQQTFVKGLQSFQWRFDKSGKNIVDDYSIETCRYFRQIEGILEGFIPTMGLLEDLELPQHIKNHTVFIKWRDLAAKMDAIQNDVLGFQKDLQLGEEDGIVMQKIRKGLSAREALAEELNLLTDLSKDYVNLRRTLYNSFQKSEQFKKYVDVVDSVLYGNFQTYVGSHKYGMKDQINIVHH